MPSENENKQQDRQVLLEAVNVTKLFYERKSLFNLRPRAVNAVNGVSLSLNKNEVLGLVGESGCGKSTLGRTLIRLIPADGGKVLFKGENILQFNRKQLSRLRRKMQMIFQDVYSSLNPRMTVEELVRAPLDVYHEGTKNERREKVIEILNEVGLGREHLHRFPHEFSGGQRQRIGFARALIIRPELVICDEPVSALDVSVRAQVLNLMKSLQEKRELSYIFISHDLSVVKHISNRIAVMYLGNIVELAKRDEIYQHPQHPYTKALLSAIPIPDPGSGRQRIILSGDLPNPFNPPEGCPFNTRCPHVRKRCLEEAPALKEIADEHFAACHLVD